MRNFYKQLAFGLIAATSPLAIQAQQAEKTDTIYKQTFDPRGSINTMTVENMDGGKGTWNEEVNGGNYYAYNVINNNVDINSNVGIDANDWLITPEVELEAACTPWLTRRSATEHSMTTSGWKKAIRTWLTCSWVRTTTTAHINRSSAIPP